MVCYLKRETYSGPISYEVQRNDIWTDNILVQQHWELELVNESQLGEVQMKPPWTNLIPKYFLQSWKRDVMLSFLKPFSLQ